jgi:hypothetical protein
VNKSGAVVLLLVCLLPMFISRIDLEMVADAEASGGMRFGVNYLSTHNHYEPYYLSDEELDRDFALFMEVL